MAGYKTPQLYDEGEEDWPLKVHVSCGTIYLDGYVNLDRVGMHPYEDRALVETNRTTVGDYWGNKVGGDLTVEAIPTREYIAVDMLADPRELPYGDQVDKIIAIQCFEHFTLTDAKKALLSWWNAMRADAVLIIAVPDPIGMAKLLNLDALEVRQWAIKNLMGDGFNAYALHHWAYTEGNLKDLLETGGFHRIERLESVHAYPSVVLRCRKTDLAVGLGREYQKLPDFTRYKNILDVGPGSFPLKEATHFLDKTKTDAIPADAVFRHCDLDKEKIPYGDNIFDFVYCSHVLEHLERPKAALAEFVRVGKSGYIEVPSVCLDFMMKQGESHPRWICWSLGPQKLVFVEKSEEQNALFTDWDRTWGSFFHHALHGSRLSAVQRAIRGFFWQNVGQMNVQASWNKMNPIKLIEVRK